MAAKTDKNSSITAITFDLDDTLWDIWPTIARAEERLHEWLALNHPQIPQRYTPVTLRELAHEVVAARPEIGHDRTWVRKQALALAAERVGIDNLCVESAYEVFFAARNDVLFFEDSLPALESLAARYTLGALSNGNADIKRVGLDHLFDFAINAVDAGAPKPEPAMFESACCYLGLEPQQIVHVGDDPELDVQGAARAGLRTVWVNRKGQQWEYGGARADAEIATLADLPGVLLAWEQE